MTELEKPEMAGTAGPRLILQIRGCSKKLDFIDDSFIMSMLE